jgi:hypothetical protein
MSQGVLEQADVQSIEFQDNAVSVRGYQNYELSKSGIQTLCEGHKWAKTSVKWNIISEILRSVQAQSYADIGCNLGMCVFGAELEFGIKSAGFDYNQQYITHCQSIANHLGLVSTFAHRKYEDTFGCYDVVSILGLIHHLYHRTEHWGDLQGIISKLSSISKHAIVEFPTENDPKAKKWTNMPGRVMTNEYNTGEFLNAASMHFSNIEKIGEVTPNRPVYFLVR